MVKFNLIDEINKLLSKLDSIDVKDYKALLSWFYKAIYFNNIYEDHDIASMILDKLRKAGYKEDIGTQEYLKSVRTLLIDSEPLDEEVVAKSIIAAIMERLRDFRVLEENLNSFIRIFNERCNKEVINEIMMEELRENIGEKVLFVLIKDGQFSLNNGVLEEVFNYQSITVDGEKIPFIGFKVGIKAVYASDGKFIFNNPYLTKDVNLEESIEIESLKRISFAKAYDDIKMVTV